MASLQDIVDSLNRRMRCAVVVDCLTDNQQVFNLHYGQLDQSRLTRILTRDPNPAAAAYFRPYRSPPPESPVRIPANRELGIESRLYMPVQHDGELLGHLWLLDPQGRIQETGLDAVRAAAEAAGLILNRGLLLADLERSRERELLRDLLAPDASLRTQAARELAASNLFVANSAVQAIVVQAYRRDGVESEEARPIALARALDEVRSGLPVSHASHLVRNDHGLLLLALNEPSLVDGGVLRVAHEAQAAASRAFADASSWEVLVGVGAEQASLAQCLTSYEQALLAIQVSRVAPIFAPIAEWKRLGIYSLLSRLPIEQLSAEALHPGLVRLLEQADSGGLARTLECYLDCGGDAKKAAAQLFIHRATLYYRLHKVESLAGVDLSSGEDRLALHLGLKLARLTGVATPAMA